MAVDPDELDRTEKLLLDTGDASSPEQATEILSGYVLQVDVRPGAIAAAADEAALATILNSAPRAFKGGVRVRLYEDVELQHGWVAGLRATEAIDSYGCERVSNLSDDYPTLILGPAPDRWPTNGPCLSITFAGWSGGILSRPRLSLPRTGDPFPAAGVLAAALGVSEAFQLLRGNVYAFRRDMGLSLWRPDGDWLVDRGSAMSGWPIQAKLHLLGLGHLGQAYLWTLGWLPFADPSAVELVLQDVDSVVKANLSTSLLAFKDDIGKRKTRLMAERAEQLGFTTRIIERRFDAAQRVGVDEPQVALVGLDHPATRAMLGNAGWEFIIDAGLGGGPGSYLDAHIHTFPASVTPAERWGGLHGEVDEALLELPAYAELERQVGDHCGVLMIAGRAVGAAFVGAFTSAVAIGELARFYEDAAAHFEFVDVSLRDLKGRRLVPRTATNGPANLGFTTLR